MKAECNYKVFLGRRSEARRGKDECGTHKDMRKLHKHRKQNKKTEKKKKKKKKKVGRRKRMRKGRRIRFIEAIMKSIFRKRRRIDPFERTTTNHRPLRPTCSHHCNSLLSCSLSLDWLQCRL